MIKVLRSLIPSIIIIKSLFYYHVIFGFISEVAWVSEMTEEGEVDANANANSKSTHQQSKIVTYTITTTTSIWISSKMIYGCLLYYHR